MYIHTFVCMYILHKFIKSSKTYSTYTEEHKEKSTQVENVNVTTDQTLLPQHFKLSQDNVKNQGVGPTNILHT